MIAEKMAKMLFGEDKRISYRIYAVVSFVLMIAAVAAAFYYALMEPHVDSDYVENVMWARAALDSGRILSDTFHYGYAMPFGGNLFMLPFVAAFGPNMTANHLGIALFLCFIVFALYVLAVNLCEKEADRYLFTAIAMLAMFSSCGGNLLHHIIYYGAAYCVTLGLMGCVIPVITGRACGKKAVKWYIGIALWSFWGAANGIAQLMLCTLPALGAIVLTVFQKQSKIFGRENAGEFKALLFIAAGTIAGFVFYKLALAGVPENDYLDTSFLLGGLGQILERLEALPSAWLQTFSMAAHGTSLASAEGIYAVLRYVLCAAVTVSPVVMIIIWKKLDKPSKLMVYNHVFISAMCIGVSVLTQRDVGNPRTLYNMMLSSFLLTGLFFAKYVGAVRWKNVAAVFTAGMVIFSSAETYKLDGQTGFMFLRP